MTDDRRRGDVRLSDEDGDGRPTQRPKGSLGLQRETPLRQPGRVAGITARIEHRRVVGGLISGYRRAA